MPDDYVARVTEHIDSLQEPTADAEDVLHLNADDKVRAHYDAKWQALQRRQALAVAARAAANALDADGFPEEPGPEEPDDLPEIQRSEKKEPPPEEEPEEEPAPEDEEPPAQ